MKAEAADLTTEKRKEVMYAIKDLKIEIGRLEGEVARLDKLLQQVGVDSS